jgi:hypothetical protein
MNVDCPCSQMTKERITEANKKLANFLFRTGVSLRLIESHSFKEFVSSINPAYATSMPCAKTLSGPLLDEQHTECQSFLEKILSSSEYLYKGARLEIFFLRLNQHFWHEELGQHSGSFNRLTNERIKKLVFIYTNCVLLDATDKNDYILEDGAVITGNDCED